AVWRRGSDNGSFGSHAARDAHESEKRQGGRQRRAASAPASGVALRADDHALCQWCVRAAAEGMDARHLTGGNGNSLSGFDESGGSVHRAASASGFQANDPAVHGAELQSTGGWALWGGGYVRRSCPQGRSSAGAAGRSGEGGGYSADQPGDIALANPAWMCPTSSTRE